MDELTDDLKAKPFATQNIIVTANESNPTWAMERLLKNTEELLEHMRKEKPLLDYRGMIHSHTLTTYHDPVFGDTRWVATMIAETRWTWKP